MSVARRLASRLLTSPRVRALARLGQAIRRRLSGGRPHVRFFHQVDDPYSHLALQALPRLLARYDIALSAHVVPQPDAAAAPEAARLAAYARRDAHRLARGLGLSFPADAPAPDAQAVARAKAHLETETEFPGFLAAAEAFGAALWTGAAMPTPPVRVTAPAEDGARLRARLGHYLGAMFQFEGEWYWGVDRLGFLEERLAPFRKAGAPPGPAVPRREARLAPRASGGRSATLDFYLSFRSPYTYLAAARTIALARASGATLNLRFVLPMVMRGLPVPRAKQLYIVRDTKREAERLGLPFGNIADPVGRGAERGLAVLHHAVREGSGPEFVVSFLRGVFAEGIDAATDRGLTTLTARAGLSEAFVARALADESWRAVAEENRSRLFALGLWGVPSFQVDTLPPHWGQDRLWMVEDDLGASGESA